MARLTAARDALLARRTGRLTAYAGRGGTVGRGNEKPRGGEAPGFATPFVRRDGIRSRPDSILRGSVRGCRGRCGESTCEWLRRDVAGRLDRLYGPWRGDRAGGRGL